MSMQALAVRESFARNAKVPIRIVASAPRASLFDLMGAARARLDPHRIVEKTVSVAALGLCLVEREIRVLEELIHLGAMLRRQRDADAGADIELMTVEIVGRSHSREQPAGERNCCV